MPLIKFHINRFPVGILANFHFDEMMMNFCFCIFSKLPTNAILSAKHHITRDVGIEIAETKMSMYIYIRRTRLKTFIICPTFFAGYFLLRKLQSGEHFEEKALVLVKISKKSNLMDMWT